MSEQMVNALKVLESAVFCVVVIVIGLGLGACATGRVAAEALDRPVGPQVTYPDAALASVGEQPAAAAEPLEPPAAAGIPVTDPRLAQRLEHWQALGFRFEGAWVPQEIATVLDVLDAFSVTYGAARFAELARTAADANTDGAEQQVTFVRVPVYDDGGPVIGWIAPMADVVVLNYFFDHAYLGRHYDWHVLRREHDRDVGLIQQMLVAHELGHILCDGMRAEAVAAGYDDLALEMRYIRTVRVSHWPHPELHPNESLATELGAWPLAIFRQADVLAFREAELGPALAGTAWSLQRAEELRTAVVPVRP